MQDIALLHLLKTIKNPHAAVCRGFIYNYPKREAAKMFFSESTKKKKINKVDHIQRMD